MPAPLPGIATSATQTASARQHAPRHHNDKPLQQHRASIATLPPITASSAPGNGLRVEGRHGPVVIPAPAAAHPPGLHSGYFPPSFIPVIPLSPHPARAQPVRPPFRAFPVPTSRPISGTAAVATAPHPALPTPPGKPWLTLIGLHEDAPHSLSSTARAALHHAHAIFGSPRHLALVQEATVGQGGRGHLWPIPLDLAPLMAWRGQQRPVVVLASGDPFWFGIGGTLAERLAPYEWHCLPQASTFSLLAARMGWKLQDTLCLGLHAAPVQQLRPHLAPGRRCLLLVRDAHAVTQLAHWLSAEGWGRSQLWAIQCAGGPHEHCTHQRADLWGVPATVMPPPISSTTPSTIPAPGSTTIAANPAAPHAWNAPVAVALLAEGDPCLPTVPGREEHWFEHDGQITKAPVRAITLAALAPRHGAWLWDVGGGSGAVSVEWCLAGGQAICIEHHPVRAANIRRNADRFGLQHRLHVVHGDAAQALPSIATRWPEAAIPHSIFIGGGLNAALFTALLPYVPHNSRVVANAVTLQTQALLVQLHGTHGGQLFKLDMAAAAPLGRMHGWHAAHTLVQWTWTRSD